MKVISNSTNTLFVDRFVEWPKIRRVTVLNPDGLVLTVALNFGDGELEINLNPSAEEREKLDKLQQQPLGGCVNRLKGNFADR